MSYKDRFTFNFYLPTEIVFGAGALQETVKEMDYLGIRQALVVTDVTLKDSAMVQSLLDTLGERYVALFPEAIPDSSLQVVGRGARVFREKRAWKK
ncbi:MAG: iron-containing alcohol dehydrogenase [Pseudomonadota bacterium]